MKKILLFSMSFIVLFFSCSKDESLEVILKQSGNLSATLKQKDGTPISDEVVYLYDFNTQMDSKKTDANGNVNFGECLEGYYKLVVEDIDVNNVTYSINQQIQVISGSSKNIELIPEDYVGSVTFKALERNVNDDEKYIYEPLSGVTAFIISSEDYSLYSYDINELLIHTIVQGITAENGEVEIENIPANQNFVIVYFHDNIEKWEAYNYTSKLMILSKNQNYEAKVVYSYATVTANFNDYSSDPVQGLNVLLVDYYDYRDYNSSISQLKTVAKKSSITNSKGDVVFTIVPLGYYEIVYYSDESDFDNQSIYVNDPIESFSIRVY